jgi:hypothetical protein
LGEVLRISIGNEAQRLVAECELGIAEEGIIGGGDEPSGHLQDGLRRSGGDPGGQLLGLGFLVGG